MNIRKLTTALAVMGAFVLTSSAATTTTNTAWNIDFEGLRNPSYERGNFAALTNQVTWTWGEGGTAYARFASVDGDRSCLSGLTEYNATNGWESAYPTGCAPTSDILELNTSGTDLQFNLVQSNSNDTPAPVGEFGTSVLVDADVYFVGAESEPNVADDTTLQAALYLMCETAQEDGDGYTAGEVTNTTLRVWTYDGYGTKNVWRALSHPSVKVEDGSWHHVQVVMDYTGSIPEVKVLIDGYAMQDAEGATSFQISNYSNFSDNGAKHLNSVSFRGTGAVDNFVGTTLTTTSEKYEFSVASFVNQQPMPLTEESFIYGSKEVEEGKIVEFRDINTVYTDYSESEEGVYCPLRLIRVFDPASPSTYTDYELSVDETGDFPILIFPTGSSLFADIDQEDTGTFTLKLPTAGATSNMLIAELYYGTYPGAATTYQLSYDLDGGAWPDDYAEVKTWTSDDGEFSLTVNPAKEGFEFAGWTTNDVPVSFPMTIKADTEFTATWTPATFLVTFKDGETTLSSTNVLYNTPVEKPADPSKEGFKFVAWATIEGTTTNEFAFATPITEDTTLYATWIEAEKPEVIAVDITSFELTGTTATVGFTAKQAGVKYTVLTNATLTGTFAEAASMVADKSDEDQDVTIDVPNVEADAMFFKLGADWPEE